MSRWRKVGRVLERALAIVGVVALVRAGWLDVARVTTSSMAPTLIGAERGEPDWIVTETLFTSGRVPARRFSVVSFDNSEGDVVAKRVVGFPGETLRLEGGALVVNGATVVVPADVDGGRGRYLAAGNLHNGRSFVVPEGTVYVLGDDTRDSWDSRFTGAVPLERVRGRVILRVWPPRRVRAL